MVDMQRITGMPTRQKVTMGILILVVIVIIWQGIGLFSGGSAPAPISTPTPTSTLSATAPGGVPGQAQPLLTQQQRPQQASLNQAPLSPREAELLKLQQETQTKYLAALNDLQMLKVEREIAETNQAIVTAKLAAVTAQKGIVDILAPPTPQVAPDTYARGLAGGASIATPQPVPPPSPQSPTDIKYTVISVSQLQNKWTAVIGYQGSLYSVSAGDILPPDGSKVMRIDKSGVILEDASGEKRRVSLVPII